VRASDAVGQILSNYQAALHLLEEAVDSEAVARELPTREIFQPVLDACAGVDPGLDAVVAEAMGPGERREARTLREVVIAERERVAITHSRLIRRRPGLSDADSERLDELAAGSHSAPALFKTLRAKVLSSG
jgi:hypothetical protein